MGWKWRKDSNVGLCTEPETNNCCSLRALCQWQGDTLTLDYKANSIRGSHVKKEKISNQQFLKMLRDSELKSIHGMPHLFLVVPQNSHKFALDLNNSTKSVL